MGTVSWGINKQKNKNSKKGTGFRQPGYPHQHWHVDVSYINIMGTFYYLCSILDGYSRLIVSWDVKESMTEKDIEIILQTGREKYLNEKPQIISDNGPQFVAKDFKEFIRICGMTHIRTSPHYPQSNGKIERWHKSIKKECIRPSVFLSLKDAKRVIKNYIEYYNNQRLHSAIGYITPKDKSEGKENEIKALRNRKLETARTNRKLQLCQNAQFLSELTLDNEFDLLLT